MGELTGSRPKPMTLAGGKPLLDHILELLEQHGIEETILLAHYKAEVIVEHFGRPGRGGPRPTIHVEEQPLGTAGGLPAIRHRLDEDFLLYYGDEIADFDLPALLRAHERYSPLATILTRPSHHPWDGHLIQARDSGEVTEFALRLDPGRRYRNLGNLGIYVLSRRILDYVPARKCGFFENVFPAALAAGETLRVHPLECAGFVLDVGTPARIAEVETFLEDRERIQRARGHRKPLQAVFLDRDGVLVEDRDLIHDPAELCLLPGAAEAVRLFNERGLRAIVVTNQPVIARGLCTEETLTAIHETLGDLLAREGARLDAIYHCPHHPETHHAGGPAPMRRGCECRKPRPGMLLTARRDFDLDLGACVMIGDSTSDIEAGINAGVRTALLDTGAGRLRAGGPEPDFRFSSLLDAARYTFD